MNITRRNFNRILVAAGAGLFLPRSVTANIQKQVCGPSPDCLPRWRGFNLNDLKRAYRSPKYSFREEDFRYIADWGFDFVRVQLDYNYWSDPGDWTVIKEQGLEKIDAAVKFADKYRCHLCLNMYRAPGFTLDFGRPESRSLWSDHTAREVFNLHWKTLARRYKGISPAKLSFNPLNEPFDVSPAIHCEVLKSAVAAIHAEDKDRLVICDGRDWGWTAPSELRELPVAYFARGFKPYEISHYKASWISGQAEWKVPTYPMTELGGAVWNKETLKSRTMSDWLALNKSGRGMMVGMFGCYNRTPHAVALAWMEDYLSIWKEVGWGWALWSLRGPGGVIDSGRRDIEYEKFAGHKLDRKMLTLLEKY